MEVSPIFLFRELEAFSQFASDLDQATRNQLERGQRIIEIMKQVQYSTLSVGEMAVSLYIVENGFLDDVKLSQVVDFENTLLKYVRDHHEDFLNKINLDPVLSEDVADKLKKIVEDFKSEAGWNKVNISNV
ncbi:MAG: hypothetical protein HRT87_07705 [Legionellales bacterium]|nr:hypothetical protein [Legionellales bacterium]